MVIVKLDNELLKDKESAVADPERGMRPPHTKD